MLNLFYRSVAKSEMNLLAIKNRIDIILVFTTDYYSIFYR